MAEEILTPTEENSEGVEVTEEEKEELEKDTPEE